MFPSGPVTRFCPAAMRSRAVPFMRLNGSAPRVLPIKLTEGARAFTRELTPLQRQVNLAIRILLLIVFSFGALIAINFFINQNSDLLQSVRAASVTFGLAPSSLFLMIVVAYALGAVRIADKGALVQQANAVESLCHVDVLCLDKTGTLTSNKIKLDQVRPLGDFSDAEARRLLGIYAHSGPANNRTTDALAAALDQVGEPIAGEVPFSSVRKWSALAFNTTVLNRHSMCWARPK